MKCHASLYPCLVAALNKSPHLTLIQCLYISKFQTNLYCLCLYLNVTLEIIVNDMSYIIHSE